MVILDNDSKLGFLFYESFLSNFIDIENILCVSKLIYNRAKFYPSVKLV